MGVTAMNNQKMNLILIDQEIMTRLTSALHLWSNLDVNPINAFVFEKEMNKLADLQHQKYRLLVGANL